MEELRLIVFFESVPRSDANQLTDASLAITWKGADGMVDLAKEHSDAHTRAHGDGTSKVSVLVW